LEVVYEKKTNKQGLGGFLSQKSRLNFDSFVKKFYTVRPIQDCYTHGMQQYHNFAGMMVQTDDDTVKPRDTLYKSL